MADWLTAVLSVSAGTGVALLIRAWLIAKVTLWSLSADVDGRRHALAVLRTLRPPTVRMRDPERSDADKKDPGEDAR